MVMGTLMPLSYIFRNSSLVSKALIDAVYIE